MKEHKLYLVGQNCGKMGEFSYQFDGLTIRVSRYGKVHRCDAFCGDCFVIYDYGMDFTIARVRVPNQPAPLAMWMCGFAPEQNFRSEEEFYTLVNEIRKKSDHVREKESRMLRHNSAFVVYYGNGRLERVAAYLGYGVVHAEIVTFLERYHLKREFVVPDEYAVWLMKNRLFCTQEETDAVMDRKISLLREAVS